MTGHPHYKALEGIRDKVYLQIHFGADYTSGEYGWTTDLTEIKRSVAWQLEKLRTDYIDVGFIHCLDEESDLAAYQANGVLDYVLSLKEQGVIRYIGLSSHTPALVRWGAASTASTVIPVPPGWTLPSSTNTTIWPCRGTSWPGSTI